jgi:hypothetical protein
MSITFQIHPGDPFEFSSKEHLNSKIWIGNVLRPLIRHKLIESSKKFIEYLDIVPNAAITDIQFTGSLANFNYTDYSDIDLHILVDLGKIGDNEEWIQMILKGKRAAWNNRHDIRIKGYEVEFYAQDSKEVHASTGVYSILKNKWVKTPSRVDFKLDKKQIMTKVISFQDRFYSAMKEELSERLLQLKSLKQKILVMRRSGLKRGGEYSNENLTFKVLRRLGFIYRVNKEINKAVDAELSLNGT